MPDSSMQDPVRRQMGLTSGIRMAVIYELQEMLKNARVVPVAFSLLLHAARERVHTS
jgi:hypothetical protein